MKKRKKDIDCLVSKQLSKQVDVSKQLTFAICNNLKKFFITVVKKIESTNR